MNTSDENPVLDFELSNPREAAALWTYLTDGRRLTVTGSEAATLYRELVLQRLATPRGSGLRGVSDPGALDRV